MSNKIIKRTSADNFGQVLNLYRELNEPIASFQDRLYKAKEELGRHKDSFNESLDYITSSRNKSLFKIERDESSPLRIRFDGFFFYIDDEKYKVSDYKFIKDFKELLTSKGFIISSYLTEDVEFLKTKNILNFDTKRTVLKKELDDNYINYFNENYVEELAEETGKYSENDNNNTSWNRLNSQEGWHLKDNILYRENKNLDNVSYGYSDFPIIIKWSEFSYYYLNEESFDYRIKALAYVNKEDTEESPYILTQEGAKILNKLYKTSNTYWGK
jgi:hypothetical protein